MTAVAPTTHLVPALQTPVVLIIFRRPNTTRAVWAQIKAARPSRLFIVADGPRTESERRQCDAARDVVSDIDWPCEVSRDYSPVNLGSGVRVSTGLDGVFRQVERAIILEDDCVPHPDFFAYCETLLERYRDEERIWQISGFNTHPDRTRTGAPYFFARYASPWGWATWRRAWRHQEFGMQSWPEWAKTRELEKLLRDSIQSDFWRHHFEDGYRRQRTDAWDLQWQFAIWRHRGMVAVPNVSLIQNIGDGPDATHTPDLGTSQSIRAEPLKVGHSSPKQPKVHPAYDRWLFDDYHRGKTFRVPGWTSPQRWRMALGAIRRHLQVPTASPAAAADAPAMPGELQTPVVFFIFRRAEATRQVWDRIRQARPTQLFIVADGPATPAERAKTEAARAIVADADWPCVVTRNYSDENLGSGPRIASGLDWVFSQVESAIVLEDDCVPHADFFSYCEVMLARFRSDGTVWQINGYNHCAARTRHGPDCFLSRYAAPWGWATWRRAWQHNEFDLRSWPEWSATSALERVLREPVQSAYWRHFFSDGYATQRVDTWHLQWLLTIWRHAGWSVTPRVSLVRNIGAGPDATHTQDLGLAARIEEEPLALRLPAIQPKPNSGYDRAVFDEHYRGSDGRIPPWWSHRRWRMTLGGIRRRMVGVVHRVPAALRFRVCDFVGRCTTRGSEFLGRPRHRFARHADWLRSSAGKETAHVRAAHMPAPYSRLPPVRLEPTLHESFQKELVRQSQATFVLEIEGGRLWGQEGTVITPDDGVLLDLSPEFRPSVDNYTVFQQCRLGPIREFSGTMALLAAPAGDVYGHWMMDVLPRLALLESVGISRDEIDSFYVNGTQKPFQRASLSLLGIPEHKWWDASRFGHVRCGRLIAPSMPALSGNLTGWAAEFLRRSFLPHARDPGLGRRIWISRSRAKRRMILNEDEILQKLASWKFRKVYLEDLDLTEQVALFHDAEIVVGGNGSSLFNVVFCRAGAAVIECFAETSVNVCQWAAGCEVNIRYGYLIGTAVTLVGTHPHESDMNMNADQIDALLRKMGERP